MSRRVLITGATGFVGSNLVRHCLRAGYEVHLLVRPDRTMWRLRDIEPHVQLVEAHLRDRTALRQAVRNIRPEWVFNLAAHGAYSDQQDTDEMVSTNISGCTALLDACLETGIEAFVQTGSSSEYGYKDHAVRESAILEPNSVYAITKAAATHYCQLMARKYSASIVVLRLYSIYGPYEEPRRLMPTLIVHGLENRFPKLVSPSTARDFVYVDDAVDAIIRAASKASSNKGSVFNVCSGVQCRMQDVVAIAKSLLKINEEPVWATMAARAWDSDSWVGCPDLIRRDLSWMATTDLSKGLSKMIEWFREADWVSYYRNRVAR